MKPFRVMSFNIRGSFVMNDGENVWPARRDLNVATIRKYAPDVIGFQEVQTGNWDDYESALPEYERILGPEYNNRDPFCYPSIFWNPERFEEADRGHFWLSETPDEHSGSWDTACFRSAQWVKLKPVDAPDAAILFLNTHLDHISELARVNGAKLISERLSGLAEGAAMSIVTGDFNSEPQSEAYAAFVEEGFTDTWVACGGPEGDDGRTFHKFVGSEHKGHGRIDWILVRPGPPTVGVSGAEIILDAEPPIYPSDHYPIIVDLALPE